MTKNNNQFINKLDIILFTWLFLIPCINSHMKTEKTLCTVELVKLVINHISNTFLRNHPLNNCVQSSPHFSIRAIKCIRIVKPRHDKTHENHVHHQVINK